MSRIDKLYTRIRQSEQANFRDLCRLAEGFGFELKRVSGSHHIYQHRNAPGNLNLQSAGKDAKPYQVRQLLAMIDQFGLEQRG